MKELRRDYASRQLNETDADRDPIAQFRAWFDEAVKADIIDVNAMSLATASANGEPAVRTVLLKEVDDRGFVFFTHYTSPKGRALDGNPRAALLFFWPALERQIRITGAVSHVRRAESEAYFASRPIDSRWAAWAAPQSEVLPDRRDARSELRAGQSALRRPRALPARVGRLPRDARADGILARPPGSAARSAALYAPGRWRVDARAPGALKAARCARRRPLAHARGNGRRRSARREEESGVLPPAQGAAFPRSEATRPLPASAASRPSRAQRAASGERQRALSDQH